MTAILRIAAFLAVFSASVAAAVVFQSADPVVTAQTDDTRQVLPDVHEVLQAEDLDERLRNDRVRLRADGRLPGRVNMVDPATGRVSPAENVHLALLQNGRVVTEFRSGADGVFEAANVQPEAEAAPLVVRRGSSPARRRFLIGVSRGNS